MTAPRSCWRTTISCVPQFLVLIVVVGALLLGLQPKGQVIAWAKQNRQISSFAPGDAALASPDGYVGSAACTRCHAEISASFSRTRMGRSLTPVDAATIKGLSLPGSSYSPSLDRHFEVFAKGDALFQSEYQTDADGKDVFRNTQKVDWIVGAAANGLGGLTKRGNFLVEDPISFYVKTHQWELSPGYESKDLGFNRPVLAGCISCHSGRPRPLDQTTGKFAAAPFEQTAIGCENCHGPGAEHIHAMTTKGAGHGTSNQGPRIVNPEKLSAGLENDICMSCHEAGDSRVLKPGKTYQDFRPGKPLDDTLSILMVPRKREDTNDSDHVQHYVEMSMSKCFRATAGQLRCATCHDPHVEPTAEEAPAYFNNKCKDCHGSAGTRGSAATKTCSLPLPARQKTTPVDNCISCHMPERAAPETAHTSLTNHRITTTQSEPWPDEAFAQTTSSLPDLVHVNRVAGRADEISAETLLEAYREIADRRSEYAGSYQKLLSSLEQQNTQSAAVQLALGRRDLQAGNADKAIEHLQHSLQLDDQQASTLGYLSQALEERGRIPEAIDASEKAVALDAYDPLLQKALIDQLIAGKQYDKAIAAMDSYLKAFPEDSMVRQMLTIAKQ